MIVTCPACSVRYVVDPNALGARGRTVRCARCAHTWHQDPPADAASPPPSPPPPQRESPPPLRETPPSLTGEQRIGGLPAVPKPRRRWGRALAWAVAIVVILVGLGAVAVYERDLVVGYLPGAARLYALAGFPAGDTSHGLVFRNVTTSRDMENGLPTLIIKGEVANVSSVARSVPKLVAILRDRSDHPLQQQSFSVPAQRLLPGESVAFQTSIAQPAEAAAGVVVTFSGGGN